MKINRINLRNPLAGAAAALLLVLSNGQMAYAADLTITTAPTGTAILNGNGGSTITTFLPVLGSSIQASATGTASAYYGVHIVSATTTGDVHWQITVHHTGGALANGDVSITEKGFFDASHGVVADSPYASAVSSGDLVLTGNSGWNTFNGDDFTNVDQISFASSSPSGAYTVTRELIDASTSMPISGSYSFGVTLNAAATSTGSTTPSTISITTPVVHLGQFCTSVTPITISGTATANSDLRITGGMSTSTASSSGAGNFSASVALSPNSVSPIMVSLLDSGGNVVATSTFNVLFDTTPPVIHLNGSNETAVFANTGFIDQGVTVTDNLDASATSTRSGNFDITKVGTYVLTYTARDCAGNTASTTRTVQVVATGNSGNGVGGGGSSIPPGLIVANSVANPNSAVATVLAGFIEGPAQGQVLGTFTFRFTRVLKQGDRGQDVVELQTKLHAMGMYKGPITGVFGKLTKAAVKAFQRSVDLPPTGVVGSMTLNVLNNS